MKVLPMDQPWASLVALGIKIVETRPRPHPSTLYGGKIAVHANKKTDFLHLTESGPIAEAFAPYPELPLPLGFIIATVEIVKSVGICEESVRLLKHNRPSEIPLGFYYDETTEDGYRDGFAWVLKNPIALREPIPFKAHQGWPDIDDDLIPEYAR